jgi:hypothetical protein
MDEAMAVFAGAIPLGVGATAFLDLWTLARRCLFGITALDYALVGRWVGHMARGRFRHAPIQASPPVPGEGVIGWAMHYLSGIGFAALLLAGWGIQWLDRPTPGPALIVGLGSVALPFLVMQPALGFGIAAAHTPDPAKARLRSLLTHAVFGAGLYLAGLVVSVART